MPPPGVGEFGSNDIEAPKKKKDYQIITVYCAHGDGGNEYRTGPIIGVFTDRLSADKAQKGQGWYGGNGGISEQKAIRLNDGKAYLIKEGPIDLDLHQKNLDDDIKKKALSKLSDEDKRVLGIK